MSGGPAETGRSDPVRARGILARDARSIPPLERASIGPRRRTALGTSVLRRGVLVFWSVWFTVVFGSNAADALVSLGWLPESWPFVSGNAALIERSVAEYGLGHGTAAGLFAGVLVWQLLAAALFWRAAFEPEAASAGLAPRAASAFAVSLAFWGALLVADEVLVVYRHVDVTLVHWCIAIAEILCLLALRDPDARRPTP